VLTSKDTAHELVEVVVNDVAVRRLAGVPALLPLRARSLRPVIRLGKQADRRPDHLDRLGLTETAWGYLPVVDAAPRPRLVIGCGVGLVAVWIWVLLTVVALRSAHQDAQDGLRILERVRANADASAIVEGRLLPDLRRARAELAHAQGLANGPLLAPLRLLPLAAPQLRSVRALSGTSTRALSVIIDGIVEAQTILAQPGGTNATRAVTTRALGQLAGRMDERLADLPLGPRQGLLPPLARARNQLALQLSEAHDALGKAAAGGVAVSDILTGPRRYLLFAANNAEMRAGSGMFLSAGELETGPDGVVLHDMTTVTQIPVPPAAVPLTDDLAARWGWLQPNVEWRNLMTSPRFDANAPLAADMWVASGHRPVDGVIVVDPVTLAGLLSATGPVEVDGRQLSADTVVDEMLHGQYLRFPDEATPERREEMGKIARAAFSALDQGDWSVSRLASGLARAGSGRHLLVWSREPAEQAAWASLGVDGALRPDSMLLSVLNRGGTKSDYFLSVTADVAMTASGDETEVVVTINLHNTMPVGEPQYVAGPYVEGPVITSGVGEGVHLGILTLDLPGAAHDARFDGVGQLAVAGRDGPCQVIGFQLALGRDEQRTVVARFRLPERRGSLRVEPAARIPPVRWRSGDSSWSDDRIRIVTWAD